MSKKTLLKNALVHQAFLSIASTGLSKISLRNVSTAAGCSTNGVFQYFGGKDALIDAAIDYAFELDRQFHDDFENHTKGLVLSQLSLADLVVAYINFRSTLNTAHFWSEILFNSRGVQGSAEHIARWHDMRVSFWQSRVMANASSKEVGRLIAVYSVMEEIYSYSLRDHLEYHLLLKETARALTASSFDAPRASMASGVSEWLGQGSLRFAIADAPKRNELSEHLVNIAAKHILSESIDTLNQRKIAKEAGTSQSMISYHFGNLAKFINEAIWRAMIIDIPKEVNPSISGGKKQKSIAEWSVMLGKLISSPDSVRGGSGFYINVARITGQVSLLARQREQLLPVVDHLRNFEGSGSYRASQTIWPSSIKISRSVASVFGVWIKGQAILNEALGAGVDSSQEALKATATQLFSAQ